MNSQKLLEKLQNINIARFATTILVFFVVIFILFAAYTKKYTATEIILVNAKSQFAAQQEDKIISNMIAFPKTLAFYDHLLALNKSVNDTDTNKSPEQRQKIWSNVIDVERLDNSTMISISVTLGNEEDAVAFSKITTRTFLDTISNYYNVKSDLDLRIIGDPISKVVYPLWLLYMIISFVLGILLAVLVEIVLSIMSEKMQKTAEKKYAEKEEQAQEENVEQKEDKFKEEYLNEDDYVEDLDQYERSSEQTSENKEIENSLKNSKKDQQEKEFLNKIVDQNTYPNYPEMPVHEKHQKSSAPDNLPIGDDSFFQNQYVNRQEKDEMILEEKENSMPSPEEADKKREHEPSPEEFKKRLNQLLRGE